MENKAFRFELIHQSKKSGARVGRIHTPHGVIDTPNFVGVGTNGTMKSLDSKMVSDIGLQLMFCNTYHLMLQPGPELIKKAGGLHTFMNRQMPIITDSGGFQVFSLMYGTVKDELKSQGAKQGDNLVLNISENGVIFRSYRDGKKIVLTPESSVQAQKDFGADIIIPFDELPPYHIDQKRLVESLHRTHRWQKRSLDEHRKNPKGQAMYAVIHGGVDPALRKLSAQTLTALPFDGFAIGGSLGKNRNQMLQMLTDLMPHLPKDKPNHLLGIGDTKSLEQCVALGIDTFDSSHPTRSARHGTFFTRNGSLKILNAQHKDATEPIEDGCTCYTCTHYTRAYLHHLFKAKEGVAHVLASIHNLHFMVQLMADYRKKIMNDEL